MERKSIELMLKFYFKTLRYLFQKYSVSPHAAAQKRLLQKDYSLSKLRI